MKDLSIRDVRESITIMRTEKIIVACDFDGVLHSFISGWTNPRDIPDLPTEGAIEWLKHILAMGHLYQVVIFGARVYHWGGKKAMKKWLLKHGLTKEELSKIRFVYQKPGCQFLLDDRVICFRGTFPSDIEILNFRPWHGKDIW